MAIAGMTGATVKDGSTGASIAIRHIAQVRRTHTHSAWKTAKPTERKIALASERKRNIEAIHMTNWQLWLGGFVTLLGVGGTIDAIDGAIYFKSWIDAGSFMIFFAAGTIILFYGIYKEEKLSRRSEAKH